VITPEDFGSSLHLESLVSVSSLALMLRIVEKNDSDVSAIHEKYHLWTKELTIAILLMALLWHGYWLLLNQSY